MEHELEFEESGWSVSEGGGLSSSSDDDFLEMQAGIESLNVSQNIPPPRPLSEKDPLSVLLKATLLRLRQMLETLATYDFTAGRSARHHVRRPTLNEMCLKTAVLTSLVGHGFYIESEAHMKDKQRCDIFVKGFHGAGVVIELKLIHPHYFPYLSRSTPSIFQIPLTSRKIIATSLFYSASPTEKKITKWKEMSLSQQERHRLEKAKGNRAPTPKELLPWELKHLKLPENATRAEVHWKIMSECLFLIRDAVSLRRESLVIQYKAGGQPTTLKGEFNEACKKLARYTSAKHSLGLLILVAGSTLIISRQGVPPLHLGAHIWD